MIQFASQSIRPQVRRMWKTVFGDQDSYMDVYFRWKYKDENTLVWVEDGKVVSSLQMLPYRFTFCGTELPILYLSGVATLSECRNHGFMGQLLSASFQEARRREIPLMLLVPQEEWLLKYYSRYSFARTFDPGTEDLISLKALMDKFPGDLKAAYNAFDACFRGQEMTVQKTFDDFRAIVEEAALYAYPAKRNLIGMARVIDVERLLTLFAGKYTDRLFDIFIHDGQISENNSLCRVYGGLVKKGRLSGGLVTPGGVSRKSPSLRANIGEMAQLLLGYHTAQKPEPLKTLFPEKRPQMHFMLE